MTTSDRIGDVVEVEWLDSEHIALGWTMAKAYRKAARHPQSYRLDDPCHVPAVAIKRIAVLGRAHKRVRKALR